MKTFVFQNKLGTLRVEFTTDLIDDNKGKFTVLQIKGLSNSQIRAGVDFRKLVYDVATFEQFALKNDLKLTKMDMRTSEVLVAFGDSSISHSYSIGYYTPAGTPDQNP